ncbi:tetratricopeptide repeat protein [Streptomyces filamentosus]|uniref:tetratricopeptide repeat protein n=1 Tax=Streptomyces filamentosus TaxID=67294 RepID=UPI00382A8BAF
MTTTRHNLALAFLALGQPTDAERELRTVLFDQQRIFGERHYYTLATRHELARAVFAQGHAEQAESETALVLAAQREVLGDDHSYTLATRHTHAEILAAVGRTIHAQPNVSHTPAASEPATALRPPFRTRIISTCLIGRFRCVPSRRRPQLLQALACREGRGGTVMLMLRTIGDYKPWWKTAMAANA